MPNELKKPSILLKIIFPEIQLYQHCCQVGFIDIKFVKDSINQLFRRKQDAAHDVKVRPALRHNGVNQPSANGNVNCAADNITHDIKNSSITSAKVSRKRKEIDTAFQEIANELPQYVLGQENYLRALIRAFKRPYLEGKCEGIRNIVFVSGAKGTGRHLGIRAITKLLKNYNILQRENIFQFDLACYLTEHDAESLFISDLYKALYGDEEVIILDNFEQCHDNVLSKIAILCMEEKLIVNRRYIEQINGMVDVTGKLELDTTNVLTVNGKILVFISELPREEIMLKFPSQFVQKVYDILLTDSLKPEILERLAHFTLQEYKEKICNNLSVYLDFDKNIPAYAVQCADKTDGAYSIYRFMDLNIYKPLIDLQLSGQIAAGETFFAQVDNVEIVLVNEQKRIGLPAVNGKDISVELKQLQRELDDFIGLAAVKHFVRSLVDNVKIQQVRANAGQKVAKTSLHMIFTGNPGSGKTTIARLVAKYLKVLGYLPSGHLIEVARNDLVGQYVGETAQKTMTKLHSAKGGVLFIDEAYALVRDKYDIFGIEAVDTIIKYIEDYRDDLVVIMAGYSEEMEAFLASNSGLKSRFNYCVEFEDYTPPELLQIAKVIANSKGYEINKECQQGLLSLFEKKQIPGKNDSGNGRLARNIVEQAIIRQSQRLAANCNSNLDSQALNELTVEDFSIKQSDSVNLEAELAAIVGAQSVKKIVFDLEKQLLAEKKRKEAGLRMQSGQTLNMIFTGNPGTGKTTIAKIVARLLKKMEILKSEKIIETDRTGLVAEYLGQSAQKTTDIFMSALGGVLFIDEAYALMTSERDPLGKEAVDTLVKLLEEHRENIVVILAGYDKEMGEFIKVNSGLKSRFPLQISFPDYTAEELLEIGRRMIISKGFSLANYAQDAFYEAIVTAKRVAGSDGGNGRLVRNIIEEAIRRQSTRIVAENIVKPEELVQIMADDFAAPKQEKEVFVLAEALKRVVGLQEVKDFIYSLQSQLSIREQRQKMGLPIDSAQTLHMIFKGNPGTGKTMMARVIGEVLYQMGVLSTKKFIETDRSGLVAGYVGQTALKTMAKVEEALNGVLFIDEAYALAQDANQSQFGKEAIDTLVKAMDDNRDRLIVILAGYDQDMDSFLEVNPGLKSRFPTIIKFADYDVDELMAICKELYADKGYILDSLALDKLQAIFKAERTGEMSGNGRFVRNVFERSLRAQAMRLQGTNLTREELVTITGDDIQPISQGGK